MIKKREKFAQSQIVSTVLLILITIVAAGLIMAFVIPFVKDKLPDQKQNCLDIISKVRLSPGYTCYNSDDKVQLVQIHIDDIRDSIKGFTIELGGPTSKAVKAIEDDNSDVKMYIEGEEFGLPEDSEERTYRIESTTKPTYIAVYPVLKNNKLCEAADTLIDNVDCPNGI